MKKLQILVTVAFIISIMSFGTFAMPEAGAGPNSNVENSNIENNNIEKGDVENNNNEKGNIENNGGKLKKDKCGKCKNDPLKRLEERKESIRKDLKEGKITKEKAEELTKKIDGRIAKIKEFNSLTLPEKKEHLSKKFSSHLEKQIQDGRITKEEGEKLQADFNKQLESWDGKEPPKFMHKIKKHKD